MAEPFRPRAASDIPYIDGESPANDVDAKDLENGKADEAAVGEIPSLGLLSFCGRWSFPWLLSLSIVQLAIYLNKLYQDSAAVAVYFHERDVIFCVVSALCLFLPALIYIMYVVALYVKDQEEAETKEIGTRFVHGLLLVPWQIKGRVEVLHFSAQRVCQRRTLSKQELLEKSALERQAAVLEFFEEFYAGFTQVLLQLYIIIDALDHDVPSKALPAEIIASALSLMSMMAAVRRRDDGILTGTFSILGWLLVTTSRAIVIALVTTVIHSWTIMFCFLHSICLTFWVWHLATGSYVQQDTNMSFSRKRKVALFWLVFAVFGLPSLVYWPVMFQLKERGRPLLYLFILLLENAALIVLWFFLGTQTFDHHHVVLVGIAGVGYVVGALFVLFYVACKPKYTDQVVYHDMSIQNAESFGMYFEFCDAAFKLPRKREFEEKLLQVRKQNVPIK